MYKKFEINRTKIKGGCQSGRKVATHNFKSDLPLIMVEVKYDTTLKYFVFESRKKRMPSET